MPNNLKKPASSQNSGKRPSADPSSKTKITIENFQAELQDALKAEDTTRAMEVLDSAPNWFKKEPEYHLIHAVTLLDMGDEPEAFRILRDVERKFPKFGRVNLPLIMLYIDREWPAHVLHAAKRVLTDLSIEEEARFSVQETCAEATAMIQELAEKYLLSFESMQRACYLNEQAQLAMEDNKLFEVDYYAKEAIKIVPNWASPYNNRAEALYYLGKTTEAIDISLTVLARDPANIFALRNLTIFHYGLDQLEEAREAANRFAKLEDQFDTDSMELEHLITVLGLVEDTPALWKIAKRCLNEPADTFFGRAWHCMAVAAVRSGQWNEALTLMNKIEEQELTEIEKSLRENLATCVFKRKPRLDWMPPTYPGVDLLFQPKVLNEWDNLLGNLSDELSPFQQKKLASFFQKYPFVLTAMKRLLWEKESFTSALAVLDKLATPDGDAEMLRFALSQNGTQIARTQAMMALINSGRYTGPKIVKLWDDDREEWRDVTLNTQRIGSIDFKAGPKTLNLIEKANKAKKPQDAIVLLKKAIEIEPGCATAVYNLGVALIESGEIEEGEAQIFRSVQVNPNYTFGHAAIGLTEAEAGNEQEANEHLEVVARAEVISPSTAVMANLAWCLLALRRRDLQNARLHLEIAARIEPDHHLVDKYQKQIEEAEKIRENFGFLFEFQRESAQRSHTKLLKSRLSAEMSLLDCLEMHTKDMLTGTAHFLELSSVGKKADVAARLAEAILDEEFLRDILDEFLQENVREALNWIIEANGVRPWNELIGKYGDDFEESVHWDYHDPESITGQLRMSGLLYSGTLDGQKTAFIPAELCALLQKVTQ